MPLVKVEILRGKSTEYKKLLLQSIHDALIITLHIEDGDRYQRLYELEPDYFERRPGKTDQFTLIELTLYPGRSKELKRSIIKETTRLLGERLHILSSDIIIVINEPPLDNWGCFGEQDSISNIQYKK